VGVRNNILINQKKYAYLLDFTAIISYVYAQFYTLNNINMQHTIKNNNINANSVIGHDNHRVHILSILDLHIIILLIGILIISLIILG
jgi:hypothetical protein